MTPVTTLYTGADFRAIYDLCDLPPDEDLAGSTIVASLVDELNTTEWIADTAQADGNGADWATNRLAVRFSAAQTSTLTAQAGNLARIQVSISRAGVRHVYDGGPVRIAIGRAGT